MNEVIQEYTRSFASFERRLNGETGGAIHALRKQAISFLGERGFPTTRDEEWRFTNISEIVRRPFLPASTVPGHDFTKKDIDRLAAPAAHRLVFVDGCYDPKLSDLPLQEGAVIGNLAEVRKTHAGEVEEHLGKSINGKENGFTALNMSFMSDGFCLLLNDGVALEEPVAMVYLSTGADEGISLHPRNLILLGEGSGGTILEYFANEAGGEYLTNSVTEIVLRKGARLEHDKIQLESQQAFHIASMHVHQEKDSTLVSNNIALGGKLARTDILVRLDDEGCACTLNGLSVGNGTQLIDNHTTIDHAMPNCNSWEMYKSVLDGDARGVFNGKIFVRKDAQKTDAKQTNQTLLLSDTASIDTKPQLEIFADDVKCTHGATVGQLDEDQVFYLRSRGVPAVEARDVLTYAFASEVVHEIHFESVKKRLEEIIHARFGEGRALYIA